jgi:hypothetical protein
VSQHADSTVALILVATKSDCEDKFAVTKEEAEALAAQHNMKLFWTSAKTVGANIL